MPLGTDVWFLDFPLSGPSPRAWRPDFPGAAKAEKMSADSLPADFKHIQSQLTGVNRI